MYIPCQRIKEFREIRGITQNEMSEKLGITVETLCAYENSQCLPTELFLAKCAEILNVSLDCFHDTAEFYEDNTGIAIINKELQRLVKICDLIEENGKLTNPAYIELICEIESLILKIITSF